MIKKKVIPIKKLVPIEHEMIKIPILINFIKKYNKYVPTKVINVPKCIVTKSEIIEVPLYIPEIS